MSTAPLYSDNSNAVGYLTQPAQACPAELTVDCNGTSIVVKPVLHRRDLWPVVRFLYEVYVEQEKLVSAEKLPPECQASRSRDKWDNRPMTRHIIALRGDEVIGHVRMLYRKDGRLPLEENGFTISSEMEDECEVSKLVLHPDFRRTDVLAAFYRQIFAFAEMSSTSMA